MMDYDRLYIDGGWVVPSGTDTIEVVSPSTEERVGRVPEGRTADVDHTVPRPGRRSTSVHGRR